MALEIRRDFPDDVHVIAVLKGAFMFLSDLVRHIPGCVSLDFMAVSSYAKGTTSSGEVRLLKDLDTSLEGKNVVIVEDIVDTGLTLTTCRTSCARAARKSLRTACLLSKPSRRKIEVRVEYVGFTIEDRFVVGYGLDYAEQYRNLPHIADTVRPERLTRSTAARTFSASALRVGDHRGLVQRAHLAILHQDLAVHDRRPHVVATRDVDQVRHRVVQRRLPRRATSRRR